jgi:hypothetical protein
MLDVEANFKLVGQENNVQIMNESSTLIPYDLTAEQFDTIKEQIDEIV